MSKPRIQVSGGQRLIENYMAAVSAAGGEPVAAYCPEPDLTCDGLLLCGGGDIECTLYGQEDQGSQPPDRDRDRAETALFRAFHGAGKPILGICRGMQMINIMLGGTMIQDLPAQQLHIIKQHQIRSVLKCRQHIFEHQFFHAVIGIHKKQILSPRRMHPFISGIRHTPAPGMLNQLLMYERIQILPTEIHAAVRRRVANQNKLHFPAMPLSD